MSLEQNPGIPATARKASASTNTDNCVYVDDLADGRAVYDSKNPTAPPQYFTEPEWQAFVAGVKAGEFD